jgi:hypothetical protein
LGTGRASLCRANDGLHHIPVDSLHGPHSMKAIPTRNVTGLDGRWSQARWRRGPGPPRPASQER